MYIFCSEKLALKCPNGQYVAVDWRDFTHQLFKYRPTSYMHLTIADDCDTVYIQFVTGYFNVEKVSTKDIFNPNAEVSDGFRDKLFGIIDLLEIKLRPLVDIKELGNVVSQKNFQDKLVYVLDDVEILSISSANNKKVPHPLIGNKRSFPLVGMIYPQNEIVEEISNEFFKVLKEYNIEVPYVKI
jgi:hypothetical protein